MLRIDRVQTEIDVIPGDDIRSIASQSANAEALLDALERDPALRLRVRALVLDALREELSDLLRGGNG